MNKFIRGMKYERMAVWYDSVPSQPVSQPCATVFRLAAFLRLHSKESLQMESISCGRRGQGQGHRRSFILAVIYFISYLDPLDFLLACEVLDEKQKGIKRRAVLLVEEWARADDAPDLFLEQIL